jgi:hypothetical protein
MWMLHKDPAQRPTAVMARDELARVAAGGRPSRPLPGATEVAPTLVSPVVPPRVARPVRPQIPPPRQPTPGSYVGGGTRVDLRPPPGGRGDDPSRDEPGRGSVPARPGRNRKGLLPAVAAAVLLLAIVVGVALAAPASRSAVPPGSPTARPTSGATAGPRPTGLALPNSASSPDGQPSGEQLQAFVRDYYALLPGDVDRAWGMLGPAARQESGSLDSYRRFYGGLSGVRFADGPTAVDGRTVRATLLFDAPGHTATGGERYTFVVEPGPDGELRMASFTR